MIRTEAFTSLDPITVEQDGRGGTHVWMRKNIQEEQREFEEVAQTVYTADETYFYSPQPLTVGQVDADFGRLWAEKNSAQLTDRELIEAYILESSAALAELADLLVEGLE
mgnify:CR=1 FL=1